MINDFLCPQCNGELNTCPVCQGYKRLMLAIEQQCAVCHDSECPRPLTGAQAEEFLNKWLFPHVLPVGFDVNTFNNKEFTYNGSIVKILPKTEGGYN